MVSSVVVDFYWASLLHTQYSPAIHQRRSISDSIMAQHEIDIELADLSSATAMLANNLVSRCGSIFQVISSWITKLAKSPFKREDRRRLEAQSISYILLTPNALNCNANTYQSKTIPSAIPDSQL
jgi:hypothetical protein